MSISEYRECESCACFLARKTARLLTQHYDRLLKPSGLRSTQYTLLIALIRIGQAVSLNTLADILGLERTTLTRNLQTLAAKAYIGTTAGADKRTRMIHITPKGKQAIRKAYPFWEKAQAAVSEKITPKTLEALAQTAASFS